MCDRRRKTAAETDEAFVLVTSFIRMSEEIGDWLDIASIKL